MKRIIKREPLKPLEKWKAAQVSGNCTYENLGGDAKDEVLKWLLREQGGLCCYTGISIAPNSSHIEHLKPRWLCRQEGRGEDVEGRNLLAAFPDEKATRQPFGAHKKDKWFDVSLFIHPLRSDCETRFRYKGDGSIEPSKDQDRAAQETIKQLGLDAGILKDRRAGVIDQMLFGNDGPSSERELSEFLSRVDRRNDDGNFVQFCFVLKQVAVKLLRQMGKEKKRKQAVAAAKRRNCNK